MAQSVTNSVVAESPQAKKSVDENVSASKTRPDAEPCSPSAQPEKEESRLKRSQPIKNLHACRKASRIVLRETEHVDLANQAKKLSEQLGLHPITAKLLICRGVKSEASAQEFLQPSLKNSLPDPTQILNIEAAAQLILEHVEQKQKITVFSDFDVDGLSSGSQLYLFLRMLGASVDCYTPNRFTEGYGLSLQAIEKLALAGTNLLVTVDCGISNEREIALAKRRSMKVVVVDHHQPHTLPPADVIVNPAQEGCPFGTYELAAAGLTWMLLIVLRQQASKRFAELIDKGSLKLPNPKEFLDLAALGTICDMVPLRAVNRTIAHRGIEAIKQTKRPGLIALKQVAGVADNSRLNSGHVGFALGPRINAAGRVGDASQVFELLTTGDKKRATSLAKGIDKSNAERQRIEADVLACCVEQVESLNELPSALALYGEDFHAGVIGIVAQRLVERYHRPAAVMAPGQALQGQEVKLVYKGSVRSIDGFHVADALAELNNLLLTHGGHAAAGGFSLLPETFDLFVSEFSGCAQRTLRKEDFERIRKADVEVALSDVDFHLVGELLALAPFGRGNPSPLLVSREVSIVDVTALGKGHLRLRLQQGQAVVNSVAWSFQGHPSLRKGKRVNIAYAPGINTYKGVSSVQLDLKEVWEE